jgi:hypothetical protein
MSRRSSTTAISRPDLGNAALTAAIDLSQYVALRVFPIVPVNVREGVLARPTVKSWLSRENTRRGIGSAPSSSQHEHEIVNVNLTEYSHEEPIDLARKQQLVGAYDAEVAAAARVTEIILRDAEITALGQLNTSTFSGSANTTAVSTAWTNAASSTPLTDIAGAMNQIRTKGGMRGKSFVLMSDRKARDLYLSAQVAGRLQYVEKLGLMPTEAQLAMALSVDEVIIARGMYDNAADGLAISGTSIWTDTQVFVGFKRDDADFVTPQLGRSFVDTSLGNPLDTYTYDEPNGKIRRVQVSMAADFKLYDTVCGHLLTGC